KKKAGQKHQHGHKQGNRNIMNLTQIDDKDRNDHRPYSDDHLTHRHIPIGPERGDPSFRFPEGRKTFFNGRHNRFCQTDQCPEPPYNHSTTTEIPDLTAPDITSDSYYIFTHRHPLCPEVNRYGNPPTDNSSQKNQ